MISLLSFSQHQSHTQTHTHTPVNVPVSVIVDKDVECVGVALSSSYEVVGLCLGAVIHLDHVALSFSPRHTLLVDALQDT